jgi:Flp pilus assembly protein TadG
MTGVGRVRTIKAFFTDCRGVAAVEFALIFPFLMMVYFGGVEVCRATATYRKLADTTVEMANVTAQYTSMSATDVTTVMNASAQIMAPYAADNLAVVMSEVTTDANSAAKVTWSVAYHGATALTAGSTVAMPTGLSSPSTSYILIQTSYNYAPTFGSQYLGNIPMTDQIFIIPRQSPDIPYTG